MITLGYLISPIALFKVDAKYVNMVMLLLQSSLMMSLSLVFVFHLPPNLSLILLQTSGLLYGLGIGPVPYILMSSLFKNNSKTFGIALAETSRAMAAFLQLKVGGS